MTKRERVLAAIEGQEVDRVPYSLWYHFRLNPPAGENMARAELDFYRRYEPDLFKVMHDIDYEMPTGLPVVETPDDWAKLPVLDGISGNFGAQLATVGQIIAEKGDDAPVIETVFSIWSTAQKVTNKRALELFREDPTAAHVGLRTLAGSISNYARAVTFNGADGIYLALSGAAEDTMPESEYREHFRMYDQQILNAAAGSAVNVVHQHGGGIYPDIGLGLEGCNVYCWSDRQAGNPSIREMRLRTRRCLMAGIDEVTFGMVTPEEIVRQGREAIAESGGRGFILAPGCAVPTPPESPDENLRAVRQAVTPNP